MRGCLVGILAASSVFGAPASGDKPDDGDSTTGPKVISFKFRRGHILVPARVNGSPELSFVLDTGYGVTTINPEHADEWQLQRVGQMTIDGIAGEETAAVYTGVTFDFAGASYAPASRRPSVRPRTPRALPRRSARLRVFPAVRCRD
jgi:hypothetical protein